MLHGRMAGCLINKIIYYNYSDALLLHEDMLFQAMPLRIPVRYVDKIEFEEFETIEAFMGSRVHEAFDMLYLELREIRDIQLHDWTMSSGTVACG